MHFNLITQTHNLSTNVNWSLALGVEISLQKKETSYRNMLSDKGDRRMINCEIRFHHVGTETNKLLSSYFIASFFKIKCHIVRGVPVYIFH